MIGQNARSDMGIRMSATDEHWNDCVHGCWNVYSMGYAKNIEMTAENSLLFSCLSVGVNHQPSVC